MNLSADFVDLLRSLNDVEARYLVVGAHALAFYSRPRATADFDVWVDASESNAVRVYRALSEFGAPVGDLSLEELTSDDLIFQIGVAPIRIDILTGIDGLTFSSAWPNRIETTIDGERVAIIGKSDLIRNKRAAGRPQDIADLQRLLEDEEDDI